MSIVLVWLIIISCVTVWLLFSGKTGIDPIDKLKNILSQNVSPSKDRKTSGNEMSGDSFVTVTEYSKIVSRVYALEQEMKQLRDIYETLLNQDRSLEGSLQQLSNSTNHMISELRQEINSAHERNYSEENKADTQFPLTVYASQFDSINPKGFTQESLTTSEGAHLYRITIETPTAASFVLTDNLAVQQELLLTLQSGVLNDTCCFDNYPIETSSQINTIECGKLIKEEGVWKICKKIKLNFS